MARLPADLARWWPKPAVSALNDGRIDEIEVSSNGDMGAVDLCDHRATLFFSQVTFGLGKRMR